MDRAFTSSVITGHFIRPLGLRHFAVLVFRFRLFFRLLADTVGDLYSNYSSRKVRTVPWVSTIMVNRNSNRKVLQTCSFPAILRSLEGYVCPSLQRKFQLNIFSLREMGTRWSHGPSSKRCSNCMCKNRWNPLISPVSQPVSLLVIPYCCSTTSKRESCDSKHLQVGSGL